METQPDSIKRRLTRQTAKATLAAVLSMPALAALCLGEIWLWHHLDPLLFWGLTWVTAMLVACGAVLLWFFKIKMPRLRKAREREELALIKKEQDMYEENKGKPCAYLTASGTITGAIWKNLDRFKDAIRAGRLKAFLLVPREDMENARIALENALGQLAHIEFPPVWLEPVTAGTVKEASAHGARRSEKQTVYSHFRAWAREALPDVRLVIHFVAIPAASPGAAQRSGDGTGFTSKTCFQDYPFLALRRDATGTSTNGSGGACRWTIFVRDMVAAPASGVSEDGPGEDGDGTHSDERKPGGPGDDGNGMHTERNTELAEILGRKE